MKITAITVERHSFKLSRPYQIAYKSIDAVDNVVVEIHTDHGISGLGSGSPSTEVTGETIDTCVTALNENSWSFVNRLVDDTPAIIKTLRPIFATTPAAHAAIDIALHDVYAQKLKKPLVDLFGRVHASMPTSITIGIKNSVETLNEAKEYFHRGFRVMKVKLGISLEDDIERLTKLREAYGSQITLRVDPNQGYSIDDLFTFIKRTDKLAIEFIEQPLSVRHVEHLAKLPKEFRDKVALDEAILTPQDAIRSLSLCGIFNIKLMKCGGIFAALAIANIADAAGLEVMWGCNDESRISISAALHTALSSSATRYLDLDGSLDLIHDIVDGGFRIHDGIMSIDEDKPGLGAKRSTR